MHLVELLDSHKAHGGLATLTTVPLRSQYGTVHFDKQNRVQRFEEKPIIRDCWINAGFFVLNQSALNIPGGNLERDVLPVLGERGELFAYRHTGFLAFHGYE